MMRGEKVADDLPLTKCGLCEEGGKHDGSKFSLRPVCGAQRIFQSEICEVVRGAKKSPTKENPFVSSFREEWRVLLIFETAPDGSEDEMHLLLRTRNSRKYFLNIRKFQERDVVIGYVFPTHKILVFVEKKWGKYVVAKGLRRNFVQSLHLGRTMFLAIFFLLLNSHVRMYVGCM